MELWTVVCCEKLKGTEVTYDGQESFGHGFGFFVSEWAKPCEARVDVND